MHESNSKTLSAAQSLSFLGSPAFFRDYWKKKPLCLRQALPNFQSPISAEELAGLACEQNVESRMVLEHGQVPWELINGPFSAKDFRKMPETHWSLLVQAVNHWVPEVHELLKHFSFLPSHYLDDIMVSYATEKGSVGPHFDYYDVFILQGTGQRHWQLGQFCSPQTATRAETPLAILQEFVLSEEYILEPGDILYIPQQQAHWCVAKQASLSYSIGFRTPACSEVLNSLCSEWMSQLDESERLTIQPLSFRDRPAQISREMYQEVQSMLQRLLQNQEQLVDWLGCYVTEPKYPELADKVSSKKYRYIDKLLIKHTFLRHNEGSRFAYFQETPGREIKLFLDGQCYNIEAELEGFIARLCDNQELACAEILTYSHQEKVRHLLQMLLQAGALYLV